MDEFKMELNSPITDEQWNAITDAELEHSKEIEFTTPSGKKVLFQKVKHGEWMRGDKMKDYPRIPYKPWMTYCSECGAMSIILHNFCPDCGAVMDGKGEQNEVD